jgi:integrase
MKERVEGIEGLWKTQDGRRRVQYEYRRLVPLQPIFENGKTKRQYKDIKRSVGGNLERAIAEAKRLNAEAEAILEGKAPRKRVTLTGFWDEYLTDIRDRRRLLGWKTTRANAGRFVSFIGSVPLERIGKSDVERFFEGRRREVGPWTLIGIMRDVRRLFNAAIQQGYLERNPASGIRLARPGRKEPRLPSEDEVKKLFVYLKSGRPALYPITVFLLYTGCRLSEALTMTWNRVDLKAGRLTLARRKVNDEHGLVMARPLAVVLWDMWAVRGMPQDDSLVFLNRRVKPFSRGDVFRAFKLFVRQIGMPWLNLKIFRKVAATWTMQAAGIRAAQQLLGHGSIRTTELYLGGGEESRVQAVRALEARMGDIGPEHDGKLEGKLEVGPVVLSSGK